MCFVFIRKERARDSSAIRLSFWSINRAICSSSKKRLLLTAFLSANTSISTALWCFNAATSLRSILTSDSAFVTLDSKILALSTAIFSRAFATLFSSCTRIYSTCSVSSCILLCANASLLHLFKTTASSASRVFRFSSSKSLRSSAFSFSDSKCSSPSPSLSAAASLSSPSLSLLNRKSVLAIAFLFDIKPFRYTRRMKDVAALG